MKQGSYKGYSSVDKDVIVAEIASSPIRQVAKKYKMPEGRKRNKGGGAKPIFKEEAEKKITEWIKTSREDGIAITKETVKEYARETAAELWIV